MNTTLIVVACAAAGLLAYDAYAAIKKGGDQTISWQLYSISLRWPIIPFIVGFLCGHIWFVQHGA